MKRRRFFTRAIAAAAALLTGRVAVAAPPPVRMEIGAGGALRIVFPAMNREQLAQIASVVLMGEPHAQEMYASMVKASAITLVMTSERS